MAQAGGNPSIYLVRYDCNNHPPTSLDSLPESVRSSVQPESTTLHHSRDVPGEDTDLVVMEGRDLRCMMAYYEDVIRAQRSDMGYTAGQERRDRNWSLADEM
jgi:hypothetical protein